MDGPLALERTRLNEDESWKPRRARVLGWVGVLAPLPVLAGLYAWGVMSLRAGERLPIGIAVGVHVIGGAVAVLLLQPRGKARWLARQLALGARRVDSAEALRALPVGTLVRVRGRLRAASDARARGVIDPSRPALIARLDFRLVHASSSDRGFFPTIHETAAPFEVAVGGAGGAIPVDARELYVVAGWPLAPLGPVPAEVAARAARLVPPGLRVDGPFTVDAAAEALLVEGDEVEVIAVRGASASGTGGAYRDGGVGPALEARADRRVLVLRSGAS